MAHDETDRTDRRKFLQAGALATASAVSLTPAVPAQQAGRQDAHPPQAEARQDRRRDLDARSKGRCGAMTASSGSPTPTASASSTPPRSTAPSPISRSGSNRTRRSARRSSSSPRTCRAAPKDMLKMVDERLAALGTDYIDLFFIHGLGDQRTRRRIHQHGHEPGVQGNGRRDPQVGQGQVHRLLDPQQGPRPDHPGGGRGRDHRRDHAPVPALARQGFRRSTRRSTSAGRRGSA